MSVVRQRPLVALIWSLPVVAAAFDEAIDFADLRLFDASHGDVADLLVRLSPDAIVVDSAASAELAAAHGGAGAVFSVVSDSQLNVVVPSGAKTGVITVSNCAGSAVTTKFTVQKVMCTVPNVIGDSIPQARGALRQGHCHLGFVTKIHSKRQGRGYVITKQSARPGARLLQPGWVNVTARRGGVTT